MRLQVTRSLIGWCAACLLGGSAALASTAPDLHLRGLALHRETGRDIYLGALYVDTGVRAPAALVEAGGPRVMEYRVVARRTSIRSLLGGMLLQSEVASARPPDDTMRAFAAAVLAAVRGSLYTGDVLAIALSDDNSTTAYLNDREITRTGERSVADYLLLGWIGERSPATAFRAAILAPDPDPQLRAELRASGWSAQRGAQVAAWFESAAAPVAESSADTGGTRAQVAATGTQAAPAAATVTPDTVTFDTTDATASAAAAPDFKLVEVSAVRIQPLPRAASEPLLKPPQPSAATPLPAHNPPPATGPGTGLQVAALMPTLSPPAPTVPEGVAALDVKEYSRRLAEFNARLIKAVYSQVHYPGRAVRRGLQGRVELDVVLDGTGTLLDVIVARSSGYSTLDKAGVRAARKAVPGAGLDAADPVASAEYGDGDNRLVIPVPISFILTE
ncbi:MAG: TonB family protein [Halioglobus sp.]|nr:TonB family protein [Halioglobus sp.]